jgi:diacylglycerol kinase (ATP)
VEVKGTSSELNRPGVRLVFDLNISRCYKFKVRPRMNEKNFSSQEICCIVNPQAANKKWQRSKKVRGYLQKNLSCQIIDFQGSKKETIEIARKQSLTQKIIVAVGGDGTVADVIQGILEAQREKDIILGIVPFGSGNAFRKSLGIPKSVKKAIRLLKEGETREIDLIDIEGKVTGIASIGATAKVTQKKLQHNIQGLLGHIIASRIMPSLPKKELQIELFDGLSDSGERFDKKILNLSLYECVVGKTTFFGYSWKVAPRAKIDDGFLDITLYEISGLKYLLFFPLIFLGLYQKTQKHYKAKKMIVRGKDLPAQYNGEFLAMKDKFEINVLPRALKVIGTRVGKA